MFDLHRNTWVMSSLISLQRGHRLFLYMSALLVWSFSNVGSSWYQSLCLKFLIFESSWSVFPAVILLGYRLSIEFAQSISSALIF